MRRGLVWGKFLPLHNGHVHLIETAQAQADQVIVVLGARTDEPMSRERREAWLRELFPQAEVRAHWDDAVIDYDDPAVWDLHLAQLRSVVPEPIDVVFTSERYGQELARRLDAEHVCVDLDRAAHPVSGTAVRQHLDGNWHHLPRPVKRDLCRRITIVGAESTGTTTLAQALAEELGTTWVPEYGRQWTEDRPEGPWRTEEFTLIAQTQSAMEDEAAAISEKPWLVCDTDALATTVWHERYVGTAMTPTALRTPALYVLTCDDIPFVQDGMRDGEHLRGWMTQRFRDVLPPGYLEVRGSVQERLELVGEALRAGAGPLVSKSQA